MCVYGEIGQVSKEDLKDNMKKQRPIDVTEKILKLLDEEVRMAFEAMPKTYKLGEYAEPITGSDGKKRHEFRPVRSFGVKATDLEEGVTELAKIINDLHYKNGFYQLLAPPTYVELGFEMNMCVVYMSLIKDREVIGPMPFLADVEK